MGDYRSLYDVNGSAIGNVKRPVDHQTSVVINARALGKLHESRTLREILGYAEHADPYHNENSGGNIYGVGKHEIAMRNVYDAQLWCVPQQSTHGLSVEVWTSWNNYKVPADVLQWPQVMGIVDTEAMQDDVTAPTRRDDVVVAISGPRSTVNTGDTTIQAGDIVLALPPQARVTESKNCVPMRCKWKGKDDQKFLTETVPFFGYSCFDTERIFRDFSQVNYVLDDDTLGDIFHHSLIRAIKLGTSKVTEEVEEMLNDPNGNHDAAAYMRMGAIRASVFHKVLGCIKDRFQLGRAMQTAHVAGQLDINLRSC